MRFLASAAVVLFAAAPAFGQTMDSLICDHHLPYWYEARETAENAERLAFVEQTIERYEAMCGVTTVEMDLPEVEIVEFGSSVGGWSELADDQDFEALSAWAERAYRANIPARRALSYDRCDDTRMIEITMTAVCRMDAVQAQLPNSLEIIAASVNGGAFLNLGKAERTRRAMQGLSAALETHQGASSGAALTHAMESVLECLDDHDGALDRTPAITGSLRTYYEAATLSACRTTSSY